MSWPSGHLGPLEPPKCPGKHRHFRDDPLACWHTSGMLACWHSRQTHGTGKLMMTHHSPILETLMAHTDDVVSLQDG